MFIVKKKIKNILTYAGLFMAGVLFRLWFASLVPQPFIYDQEEYYGFALGILKEGLHADIYRLYGYPLVIAPLVYFFGVKSPLPWTVFNSLVDTSNAFLVYWMAKKLYSCSFFIHNQLHQHRNVRKKGREAGRSKLQLAPLVAFILYLFNPFTAGYAGVLLSEITATFLVTAIFAMVLKSLDTQSRSMINSSNGRKSLISVIRTSKSFFLLAFLLGFLPQVRPAFIYWSFIVLVILFYVRVAPIHLFLNKVKISVILMLLYALPFSYNIVTNYTHYHEFAPLSVDRVFARELYSSLFIDRGLAFTDTKFGDWPQQALQAWGELAQPKSGPQRDIVAKKYIGLSLNKIQKDPVWFIQSRIAKMGYVWEKHFLFPYIQGKPGGTTKALIYWGNLTLLAFGILGFMSWIRGVRYIRDQDQRKSLYWFGVLAIFLVVYISAAHAISTSEERFSLPAYPLVFLFAGFGSWQIGRKIKSWAATKA